MLCAAADRFGFPQSARVIGVGCCSCTVAVTGLLSAVVVGVGLVSRSQRIAVCIVSVSPHAADSACDCAERDLS